jgi:flavin reductase (DIM6/NTAB) family NADH-FMN oxidoreductase RutF
MEPVSQPPLDALTYRAVVGRFATGVTVVSARVADGVRLMTVSSFTSVSLDPLLVLFCVDNSARFYETVMAAGQWGVSILAADQEHLSRLFATRANPMRELTVPHRAGPMTGAPLLDGAVAHLECRTVAHYPGGDHTILLGSVLAAEAVNERIGPLLYHRGGYGFLG